MLYYMIFMHVESHTNRMNEAICASAHAKRKIRLSKMVFLLTLSGFPFQYIVNRYIGLTI